MADFDAEKHCGAQRANQPQGVRCKRPKGWGTDHPGRGHCKKHGGATETHRRRAQREAALEECAKLGMTVDIDPTDALLQLLGRAWANIGFYQRLVDELETHPDPDEWIPAQDGAEGYWRRGGGTALYGATYHESGTPTGDARAHILLRLLQDEEDRAARLAVAGARIGIEEKRALIEQRRGEIIAELICRVLDHPDMALTAESRQRGRQIAGNELRMITGGKA